MYLQFVELQQVVHLILFTFSQSAVCLLFFNFFSPSVRYEAAGTLITLSTAPTAVKAAASCYIGTLFTHTVWKFQDFSVT